MRYLISGLIALILIGCASTPEGRDSSVVQQNRAALQRTIQQTVSGRFWHRNLAGLNARSLVAQFYQRRHYQPAWVLLSHQQPRQRALLRILQAADQEGLNPSDYHVATLATEISLPKPWKRILSPEEIQQLVRRELAWTDAYLAYAHHVSLGQLYPTGRKLYWQRHPSRNALLSQLLPALHSGKTLTKTLRGLIPRQAGYLRL